MHARTLRRGLIYLFLASAAVAATARPVNTEIGPAVYAPRNSAPASIATAQQPDNTEAVDAATPGPQPEAQPAMAEPQTARGGRHDLDDIVAMARQLGMWDQAFDPCAEGESCASAVFGSSLADVGLDSAAIDMSFDMTPFESLPFGFAGRNAAMRSGGIGMPLYVGGGAGGSTSPRGGHPADGNATAIDQPGDFRTAGDPTEPASGERSDAPGEPGNIPIIFPSGELIGSPGDGFTAPEDGFTDYPIDDGSRTTMPPTESVPEPGTLLLVSAGAAVALLRRRQAPGSGLRGQIQIRR